MLVSTPYTECYVKKSFLSGKPNYGKDETSFGIITAIRFIRNRAPLFFVYFPSMGALYDKVDQCAIFNKEETPEGIASTVGASQALLRRNEEMEKEFESMDMFVLIYRE